MALRLGNEYKEIAEQLVDKFPVAFAHIQIDKILFLVEDEKKPKKYADVRKVGYPYNFMSEYKFIITFYDENVSNMNDSQKHMLVFHEMLHIHSNFDKLRKHNIEDFLEIVVAYGAMWDTDENLPDILEENELPMIPED